MRPYRSCSRGILCALRISETGGRIKDSRQIPDERPVGSKRRARRTDSEPVSAHYASGYEADRLKVGPGQLERERTRELLTRFLPPAPALLLDVGGGPGEYACWLARKRYEVHLIDVTPLHVQMAEEASQRQPKMPLASASVGDARSLSWRDGTVDAVLLFGPLYHLTSREDRLQALREACRVLKQGGVLLAVGISRFASALDGLHEEFLKDLRFVRIVEGDLKNGQHRNPTNKPEYFTDTFFHHPDELRDEVASAGFAVQAVIGIEGPGWLANDFESWWGNEEHRKRLLHIVRTLEREPALLGASLHLMAVARRQESSP